MWAMTFTLVIIYLFIISGIIGFVISIKNLITNFLNPRKRHFLKVLSRGSKYEYSKFDKKQSYKLFKANLKIAKANAKKSKFDVKKEVNKNNDLKVLIGNKKHLNGVNVSKQELKGMSFLEKRKENKRLIEKEMEKFNKEMIEKIQSGGRDF